MARPSNEERSTPEYQKKLAREVCADALRELKLKIKKANPGELTAIVTKLLPVVLNEDTQSQTDMTMELLAQKAIRVSMRVREANEQNLKEEEIEESVSEDTDSVKNEE